MDARRVSAGSHAMMGSHPTSSPSWLCRRCVSSKAIKYQYPANPDVYCETCGNALDAHERIAAALAIFARDGAAAPGTSSAETVDVREAARLLKTTAKGMYNLRARGILPPSIGPGRRLLWRRADLLEWAARVSTPGKRIGR